MRLMSAQRGPEDIWKQHCRIENKMRVMVTALPTTVPASEPEALELVLERGRMY